MMCPPAIVLGIRDRRGSCTHLVPVLKELINLVENRLELKTTQRNSQWLAA